MKKEILTLSFLFVATIATIAQNDTLQVKNQEKKPEKEKKITFIPLPVIAYNPSNGLMYGLAPGASWFMGDKNTTSISSGFVMYLSHTFITD